MLGPRKVYSPYWPTWVSGFFNCLITMGLYIRSLPPSWTFGLWLSTSFLTDYDEKTVTGFLTGMKERDCDVSPRPYYVELMLTVPTPYIRSLCKLRCETPFMASNMRSYSFHLDCFWMAQYEWYAYIADDSDLLFLTFTCPGPRSPSIRITSLIRKST